MIALFCDNLLLLTDERQLGELKMTLSNLLQESDTEDEARRMITVVLGREIAPNTSVIVRFGSTQRSAKYKSTTGDTVEAIVFTSSAEHNNATEITLV